MKAVETYEKLDKKVTSQDDNSRVMALKELGWAKGM
jgi:hypothetical protein